MKDTKIINPSGKSIFAENKRSGQVGWLSPKNLKSISLNSLIDRIELFTGLTTKTSENFQIVNYGLAGHYTPHHDAFARTFKVRRLKITIIILLNLCHCIKLIF